MCSCRWRLVQYQLATGALTSVLSWYCRVLVEPGCSSPWVGMESSRRYQGQVRSLGAGREKSGPARGCRGLACAQQHRFDSGEHRIRVTMSAARYVYIPCVASCVCARLRRLNMCACSDGEAAGNGAEELCPRHGHAHRHCHGARGGLWSATHDLQSGRRL